MNTFKTRFKFINIKNALPFLLLIILLIFFLTILFLSEGYYGGADSLTHYMFSRYSWQNPTFLLHHWAKPVFTLLTSPFAQFGHTGVSIFNILTGILTAYLSYRIVLKLNYQFPWYVIILTCFIPIYTISMLSGLTEILFGYFIIWSIYLCFYNYYSYAVIVASFMPLVRTEGIVIMPIIGLFILLKKRYQLLPLFLTGTLIYSIIGYFFYGDIFWLITQMPYKGATDLYGTGSLLHFVKHSPIYFSGTIVILTSIGLLYLLFNFVKNSKSYLDQVVLLVLPFVAYFAAHSVMWWSGIGNSLGLYRYMAAIAPLSAIMSLYALDFLYTIFQGKNALKKGYYVFLVVLLFLIVQFPIKKYRLPQRISDADKVMKDASDFILNNELLGQKIYYYDPAFFYFLDINPYDTLQSQTFVNDPLRPELGMKDSSILIWDAHFSPMYKLIKQKLLASKHFTLLNTFRPDNPFKIFDRDYEVLVFQRSLQPDSVLNIQKYKNQIIVQPEGYKQIYYQDFQNVSYADMARIQMISDSNRVFVLDSSSIHVLTQAFNNLIGYRNVYCEISIVGENYLPEECPYLVVEKRHNNKMKEYFANNKVVSSGKERENRLVLNVDFENVIKSQDVIKVYVWNSKKTKCYLDQFYIGVK